jgi:hypothetical protein
VAEGLGPGEVGKEIAHHAQHAGRAEASGRDRVITIVEASLLAIVALMAAWSGYAAAKWSTESRLTVAEASTTRNLSSTADLSSLDIRLGDGLVFNAWLGARATKDPDAEAITLRRFNPNLRRAFDAWIATNPDTNPDSPPGPQAMPEYKQPDRERAARLSAKAEKLFADGSDQGQTGDDYVRTTVYLASVLFIVGISSHFPVRSARYGLIIVGGVILVLSAIQLITLPKPV